MALTQCLAMWDMTLRGLSGAGEYNEPANKMKPPESDNKSDPLRRRAESFLVGGVNSPVRAFGAVGGGPIFVEKASGPFLFDADGRRLIDMVGSWGPAIVGHAHPDVVDAVQTAAARGLSFGACCSAEADLAEIILSAFDSADRIRFVNSGTEAVMTAIRLARAATGREKIIKFAGCYHGHSDALLVSAGSGAATFGVPDSAGVTAGAARDTLIAPYNDADATRQIADSADGDLAAIIVEPIAGNMGYVAPADGFLESLRALCDATGSLLIFDEVMTGFRVTWGGYQNRCRITPDLTCLGKVIGGGLPCAAVAGPRELMDHLSPAGSTYQAGTLSGNPLAMAAGLATLKLCRAGGFYDQLDAASRRLIGGITDAANESGVAIQTGAAGGLLGFTFSATPINNFDDARGADHSTYARFFHAMLTRGVFLPPSGYEAMFISAAHDNVIIDQIIQAVRDSFRSIQP